MSTLDQFITLSRVELQQRKETIAADRDIATMHLTAQRAREKAVMLRQYAGQIQYRKAEKRRATIKRWIVGGLATLAITWYMPSFYTIHIPTLSWPASVSATVGKSTRTMWANVRNENARTLACVNNPQECK